MTFELSELKVLLALPERMGGAARGAGDRAVSHPNLPHGRSEVLFWGPPIRSGRFEMTACATLADVINFSVELVKNDHTPLDPPVTAEVQVFVITYDRGSGRTAITSIDVEKIPLSLFSYTCQETLQPCDSVRIVLHPFRNR